MDTFSYGRMTNEKRLHAGRNLAKVRFPIYVSDIGRNSTKWYNRMLRYVRFTPCC
jgi:hypothetical protein